MLWYYGVILMPLIVGIVLVLVPVGEVLVLVLEATVLETSLGTQGTCIVQKHFHKGQSLPSLLQIRAIEKHLFTQSA